MTTEVTCPTCGTLAQLDEVNRDAQAFCRVCDYPLFWIRAAATGEGEGGLAGDPGLRRLPGTAGLVTVATLSCWNCNEPNAITGIHCIRCGLELHPVPVFELPPPPPPEPEPVVVPEPVPPKPPLIPREWRPAAFVGTLLVLWCLAGAITIILR